MVDIFKEILNSEQKSAELSELIGIILGDGHMHTFCNRIYISGSLFDELYYKNRVSFLFDSLFNLKPKIYKRSDRNSYILQVENKKVFNFLVFDLGLLRGRKKLRASIPNFIINNERLFPFLLRGLFDTDGSFKFSKQNKGYAYYPRIRLSSQESPMIEQIKYCLSVLGFNYGFYINSKKGNIVYIFEISGKKNFFKWMDTVGSLNLVHFTKFLIWKKFGYYDKSQSFYERCSLLNIDKNL